MRENELIPALVFEQVLEQLPAFGLGQTDYFVCHQFADVKRCASGFRMFSKDRMFEVRMLCAVEIARRHVIGIVVVNLQRFSSSGLGDVEALVQDARRSINRIESSISSIERDPSRVIFGGDTVKQYDGRTRR